MTSRDELSQLLALSSIELFSESFVFMSVSRVKLGMLLELVRVLEQGMFSFILGEEQLSLVVNERTWHKLEFDFDEGRTITGLRLIAIRSKIQMNSAGLTKLLADVLGERMGSVVLTFENQYLLVHENDAELVFQTLKGLA
ncbi:MAG: hypothetical protein ACE5OZ_00575 [Candidatus Heimdallarchaeota archaeon]